MVDFTYNGNTKLGFISKKVMFSIIKLQRMILNGTLFIQKLQSFAHKSIPISTKLQGLELKRGFFALFFLSDYMKMVFRAIKKG